MPGGGSSRSRQRKSALRILFEIDINRSTVEEVLEGKSLAGEEEPSDFALQLVRGVVEHRGDLDRLISDYTQGWELDRMPGVDRNIMRMALFELLYMDDIPVGATIDEAVELAKEFSTEDSGKFINGVIGRINRDRESGVLEPSD